MPWSTRLGPAAKHCFKAFTVGRAETKPSAAQSSGVTVAASAPELAQRICMAFRSEARKLRVRGGQNAGLQRERSDLTGRSCSRPL